MASFELLAQKNMVIDLITEPIDGIFLMRYFVVDFLKKIRAKRFLKLVDELIGTSLAA